MLYVPYIPPLPPACITSSLVCSMASLLPPCTHHCHGDGCSYDLPRWPPLTCYMLDVCGVPSTLHVPTPTLFEWLPCMIIYACSYYRNQLYSYALVLAGATYIAKRKERTHKVMVCILSPIWKSLHFLFFHPMGLP